MSNDFRKSIFVEEGRSHELGQKLFNGIHSLI